MYQINPDQSLNICENCSLANCQICLHNSCFLCESGFELINRECYDCNDVDNQQICFPDLKVTYFSPLVRKYKTALVANLMTNILEVKSVSCEESEDFEQCESCSKITKNKLSFLECLFYSIRYQNMTKIKSNHITQIKNYQHSPTYLKPTKSETPKIQSKNMNISPPIRNCIFKSNKEENCFLCEEGFYSEGPECMPCSIGCSKCVNKNKCLSCLHDFRLKLISDSTTICEYKNKENQIDKNKCLEVKTTFPNSELAKSKCSNVKTATC
jgi:hypothetical protein